MHDSRQGAAAGGQSARPLVVAVLTAVAGSVLTTLLASGAGAPPVGTLVATVAGAAIPPLIATAGPFHALRLSVAVLAAAIGLAIAYGGFSLTYGVSGDKPGNLPLPGGAAKSTGRASGRASGGSGGPVLTESGAGPGIEVNPDSVELTCVGRGQGCLKTVTVRSTGKAPLRIGNVLSESEGVRVAAGECAHRSLARDASCTVSIWLIAEGPPTRVVIHQNLPGKPSYVRVVRSSGPSSPDGSPPQMPEASPSPTG
ncbi:hypothetical protein [Actinomadura gamaensis]|uniref:Uncharacterized protein n=1 Tax=Actinomadura gamaensis TaxID=1763541 RepID=A0ABV9U1Q5_9ACTN